MHAALWPLDDARLPACLPPRPAWLQVLAAPVLLGWHARCGGRCALQPVDLTGISLRGVCSCHEMLRGAQRARVPRRLAAGAPLPRGLAPSLLPLRAPAPPAPPCPLPPRPFPASFSPLYSLVRAPRPRPRAPPRRRGLHRQHPAIRCLGHVLPDMTRGSLAGAAGAGAGAGAGGGGCAAATCTSVAAAARRR
jgi:hypothetical protein